MATREQIMLEVCESLVRQADMKLYSFMPIWKRFCLMATTGVPGVCLGGYFTIFFGDVIRGRIIGYLLGALLGAVYCDHMGRYQKNAADVIKNGLTSNLKWLFVEYVDIFFEGMDLIDTATTLSALSKRKDKEVSIRRTVGFFFRSEMNYVVGYKDE